jgi:hypothetical protein
LQRPSLPPGEQTGAGTFAITTFGRALTVFASLVARAAAAEEMEEALNPTTARAITKLRIAKFFILGVSP